MLSSPRPKADSFLLVKKIKRQKAQAWGCQIRRQSTREENAGFFPRQKKVCTVVRVCVGGGGHPPFDPGLELLQGREREIKAEMINWMEKKEKKRKRQGRLLMGEGILQL